MLLEIKEKDLEDFEIEKVKDFISKKKTIHKI